MMTGHIVFPSLGVFCRFPMVFCRMIQVIGGFMMMMMDFVLFAHDVTPVLVVGPIDGLATGWSKLDPVCDMEMMMGSVDYVETEMLCAYLVGSKGFIVCVAPRLRLCAVAVKIALAKTLAQRQCRGRSTVK